MRSDDFRSEKFYFGAPTPANTMHSDDFRTVSFDDLDFVPATPANSRQDAHFLSVALEILSCTQE